MIKFEDVKDFSCKEYFSGEQFACDIFQNKYSHTKENGVKETPAEVFYRVASGLLKNKKERDICFSLMYEGWFRPGGSIMQGVGAKVKSSLANCTTVPLSGDSLEAISKCDYDVMKCAAFRQGIGFDASKLRPEGTDINNAAQKSTGVVPWINKIVDNGKYVGQLGRMPALLVSLSDTHPDIFTFITSKIEKGEIENANISVQLSDKFMEAVKSDSDWELRFDFDNGYDSIIRKVKAKEIFDLIAETAYKSAEPGVQFCDQLRKGMMIHQIYEATGDERFKGISSNACLPKFAKVLTKDGEVDFGYICIGDEIWSGKDWTKVVNKWYKGKQDVYKFSTDKGHFVGTIDHLVFSNGVKVEAGRAESIDSPADRVGGEVKAYPVKKTKYLGRFHVYDIEVDCPEHCFWTGGVIVSNCSEKFLSPYGICNLNSINMEMFDAEDYEKQLGEIVPYIVRMADAVVDYELEHELSPLPEQRWILEQTREIGCGITNIHGWLMKQNLAYDSDEGIDKVTDFWKEYTKTVFQESVELGKEKGNAPAYGRIDTKGFMGSSYYSNMIDAYYDGVPVKHMRNMAHMSIAPTGSLSNTFPKPCVSSGIEPVIAPYYWRKTRIQDRNKYQYYFVIPNRIHEFILDSLEKDSEDHKKMAEFSGSILDEDGSKGKEYIEIIERNLSEGFFKPSHEIDYNQKIKMMSKIYQWMDASISCCLVGESIISTSKGTFSLKEIAEMSGNVPGFNDIAHRGITVRNIDNKDVPVSAVYLNGEKECLSVKTEYGRRLTGTKDHKVVVLGEENDFKWIKLQDIKEGDYIVCRKGLRKFGSSLRTIQTIAGKFEHERKTNSKEVILPEKVSMGFARFLGYITADGGLSNTGFFLSQENNNVVQDFRMLVKTLFNLDSVVRSDKRAKNLVSVVCNSCEVKRFLEYIGIRKGASNKCVPDIILKGAGALQVKEFIKGLTLDGHVTKSQICVMTSVSHSLLEYTQELLYQFGIRSGIYVSEHSGEMVSPTNGLTYSTKDSWSLVCTGDDARKYINYIGFAEDRKILLCKKYFSADTKYKVETFVPDNGNKLAFRKDILPKIKSKSLYDKFHPLSVNNVDRELVRIETLKMFKDMGFNVKQELIDDTYDFIRVKEVLRVGTRVTYDLSVPDGHSYIANGMITHNTYNLPKTATAQDVKDIYMAAYEHKVRAVSVYVEGSREGILLTEFPKEQKSICEDSRPVDICYNCAPKRPKELFCNIHQVTVKGEKWVVLVGMFNKKPFEVFCGSMEDIYLPKKCNEGIVVKQGNGKYSLKVKIRNSDVFYEDIAGVLMSDNEKALTRLLSLNLRHGVYTQFIVDQLKKSKGAVTSFSTAISRVLGKYVIDYVMKDNVCPMCGKNSLSFEEGCIKCLECDYSRCD